jgi:hypothetical protein
MDVAGFRALGRCRRGRLYLCEPEIVEQGEETNRSSGVLIPRKPDILVRVDAGRAVKLVCKDSGELIVG